MVDLTQLFDGPFQPSPSPAAEGIFWEKPLITPAQQKLIAEYQGAGSAYERKQIMKRVQKEMDEVEFSE